MAEVLYVRPLGPLARYVDAKLTPVMRALSGAPNESPQRTHIWNNTKLRTDQIAHLVFEDMVHCKGDPTATKLYPFFHIPILGGWRNYVVLRPIVAHAMACGLDRG